MKTKIDLTCPKCNATLSVDSNRDFLFCEYCGAKILLNDENTYAIRHVDEAELVYAETERLVRLKEFELAERKAEITKEKNKKQITFSIFIALFGVFLIIAGFLAHSFTNYPVLIILSPMGGLVLIIAFCLVMATFE